ncbi:MAG TPA: hypothetical protein VGF46_04595 [Gaiellales bacterium]
MRRWLAAGLVGLAVAGAAHAAGEQRSVRGPFLLVSLPSMGSATWRCDTNRHPGLAPHLPGLALGFDASGSSATEQIRLRVGRRTIVSRRLQPGQSLQLPFLRARVQALDVLQATSVGAASASITVDFLAHPVVPYCWPYAPPRIDVHVSPRH